MDPRRPEPRVAVLTAADEVARDTFVYRLQLDQPLPFVAGQFVNLAVPDAKPRGERSYSVWSGPGDPSALELCIKLFEGGAASEYLRGSRVGDILHLRGPFGIFAAKPDHDPLIFVATATGLAPFRSMLEVALTTKDPRKFRVYFGVRCEEDLFGLEDLERYKRGLPDFQYQVCLSRPSPAWTGFTGRVTHALAADFPTPTEHFYLCGNGAMIEETRDLLKGRGLERKHIHVEKYY
ncbi:MAG: FAD-binding oxidoreductase [Pseudomonadota bacterium]|nr:FAD-binding oxidoreductase [Pseudomonadota bacterium]